MDEWLATGQKNSNYTDDQLLSAWPQRARAVQHYTKADEILPESSTTLKRETLKLKGRNSDRNRTAVFTAVCSALLPCERRLARVECHTRRPAAGRNAPPSRGRSRSSPRAAIWQTIRCQPPDRVVSSEKTKRTVINVTTD